MDSLIGYDTGYYTRSVKCADCGELIPAGNTVYGHLHKNRSLSHRICRACHCEREDKALQNIKDKELKCRSK
jgi:hypothetical protein